MEVRKIMHQDEDSLITEEKQTSKQTNKWCKSSHSPPTERCPDSLRGIVTLENSPQHTLLTAEFDVICYSAFLGSKEKDLGGPAFEDSIVTKGDSGVCVKCCVVWWLIVLVIKLHSSISDNSNFSGTKCGALNLLFLCPFLWKHHLASGKDFHTLQTTSSSKPTLALERV